VIIIVSRETDGDTNANSRCNRVSVVRNRGAVNTEDNRYFKLHYIEGTGDNKPVCLFHPELCNIIMYTYVYCV
jgi:hypothetical protein